MLNVSVIVATFGARAWEEQAVRAAASAAVQGTHEVIRLHRDDATLAAVRNEAAAGAIGDWLCFLDADDELAAGYLSAMAAAFARTCSSPVVAWDCLLVPNVQYVDAGERPQRPRCLYTGLPLIETNWAVVGTLVSRGLFERVGGFHEWSIYEDWELWLRCVRAGARMVAVPAAVYRAHVTPGGRNGGPSAAATYEAIRRLHEHGFDWRDTSRYVSPG